MAKGGGGSGRGGGGGGGGGGEAGIGITPNATGGRTRQIRGKDVNTAAAVNEAIRRGGQMDFAGAESALRTLGNQNPSAAMINDYARQKLILGNLEKVSGASTSGQIGKWNFSNAQTITQSFDSYLNRRVAGQRAEWTRRTRR